MSLRFVELFAGAGGLSLGLERAGWTCVGHAEIDPNARAVLSHRWPDVPLYGDVTTLDGRALAAAVGPIDLLSGGSPCQDLSVAGKRAGLGGARSSLFFEQMRLWDETGADLCLWENVNGALSSNGGRDFGAVLRAFVGAAVPVPSDGWRSAGVAAGPTGVAAWRVLDAQFFGVPQRRRRVFVLGTRTGRVDPAEILSLAESLCGDSSASATARENAAADARGGAASESGPGWWSAGGSVAPLRAGQVRVSNNRHPAVIAFDERNVTSPTNRSNPQLGDPHHTLHDPRRSIVCLTGDITHALTHEGHDASEDGTGRGTPIVAVPGSYGGYLESLPSLRASSGDAGGGSEALVVGTLDAREKGGGFPGSDGAMNGHVQAPHGNPRRLMPIECERLMAWPDNHTLVPNANGKPMSDAARYRLCGNGVASVHSHWIGWRLALALERRVVLSQNVLDR